MRAARCNRWFMQRATRFLVRKAGIRQFLDIGTGIPTEPNLHRIAQGSAPESRVVYVDNDPVTVKRGIDTYRAGGVTLVARSHGEVGRFFAGLDLVRPEIVSVTRWRPDLAEDETPEGEGPVSLYGGVGVKR